MKILLTGAGGFVGQYFAGHLNHDIDACDRSALDLTDSLAVQRRLASEHYDAVIHCASAGRNTARAMDDSIIVNNLKGFANLVENRHRFGMLINMATGAEFDIDRDIDSVSEDEIFNRYPLHSYGRSKNIIARQVHLLPYFYNLRIFGCFDSTEADNRPLKSFVSKSQKNEPFVIPADRQFDMISVGDIVRVIEAVLANKIHDKDINLVYNKKYYLSEILTM
mgnify:CR=1 FL=1